jgi:hypothetical protein
MGHYSEKMNKTFNIVQKYKKSLQIMAVTTFIFYLSLLCYQNINGLHLSSIISDNLQNDRSTLSVNSDNDKVS